MTSNGINSIYDGFAYTGCGQTLWEWKPNWDRSVLLVDRVDFAINRKRTHSISTESGVTYLTGELYWDIPICVREKRRLL